MLRRINPNQVRLGMYIHALGGSFFRHPFWRSRFRLTAQSDVDALRACAIPFVEIDDELGCGPVDEEVPEPQREPQREPRPLLVESIGERPAKPPRRRVIASSGSPGAAERAAQDRAIRTVARAKTVVRELFDTARLGKSVPVEEAIGLVTEIDEMFERGEHMLLDAVRMKTADEYTYLHSVAVCALMLKLARQLGMPEAEARDCGLAGLLHDVGKMRVPGEVLHKRGSLTDDEFTLVKSHAHEGFLILQDIPDLPAAAVEVAHLHHEKIDGSGYPLGLSEAQIPTIARMGAICDVYDALTSNRAYKAAWSPARALEEMVASKGHFDSELLKAFAASIDVALPVPEDDRADGCAVEEAAPA